MQTSVNGKAFLIQNEGTCLTIKPDNKGPQIGHGHDLTPAEQASNLVYGIDISNGITMDQADSILDQDLAIRFEPFLNGLIDPSCTQNQFDSLIDFEYNEGAAHLATMMHHGWALIPHNMPAWIYATEEVNGVSTLVVVKGLVRRRQQEVELFQQV